VTSSLGTDSLGSVQAPLSPCAGATSEVTHFIFLRKDTGFSPPPPPQFLSLGVWAPPRPLPILRVHFSLSFWAEIAPRYSWPPCPNGEIPTPSQPRNSPKMIVFPFLWPSRYLGVSLPFGPFVFVITSPWSFRSFLFEERPIFLFRC